MRHIDLCCIVLFLYRIGRKFLVNGFTSFFFSLFLHFKQVSNNLVSYSWDVPKDVIVHAVYANVNIHIGINGTWLHFWFRWLKNILRNYNLSTRALLMVICYEKYAKYMGLMVILRKLMCLLICLSFVIMCVLTLFVL